MSQTVSINHVLVTMLGLGLAYQPVLGESLSVNSFQFTCEKSTVYKYLQEDEIIPMGLAFSQDSLAEDWDTNDDARWESLMKY